MKPTSPQRLFKDLAASAQRVASSEHPTTMHHSNGAKVWLWDDVTETSLAIKRRNEVFHLQIRLEQRTQSSIQRVVIFGRRLEPKNNAAPNTQRATFNSGNRKDTDYWIRPQILEKNAAQRNAFATLLPPGQLPHWDGERFQLGHATASELLERYLLVLQIVEQVKSVSIGKVTLRFPPPPQFSADDFRDLQSFNEGAVRSLSVRERKRCRKLLALAREYFQQRSADGQLRCAVCEWTPAVPVRSEIVQLHHIVPLSKYAKGGKQVNWSEAIANFHPLCPNCHRVLESHPDGHHYTIEELRLALPRHQRVSRKP